MLAVADVWIAGVFGLGGALVSVGAGFIGQWFELRREARRNAESRRERLRTEQLEATAELLKACYLLAEYDDPSAALVERALEAHAVSELVLPQQLKPLAAELVHAATSDPGLDLDERLRDFERPARSYFGIESVTTS